MSLRLASYPSIIRSFIYLYFPFYCFIYHLEIQRNINKLGDTKNSAAYNEIRSIHSFIKRCTHRAKICQKYKEELDEAKESNKELNTQLSEQSKLSQLYKSLLLLNGIEVNEEECGENGNNTSDNIKKNVDDTQLQQVKYRREYEIIEKYAICLEHNLNLLRSYSPFAGLLKAADYIIAINKGCKKKKEEVKELEEKMEKQKQMIEDLKAMIYNDIDSHYVNNVIDYDEEKILELIKKERPEVYPMVEELWEKNKVLKARLTKIYEDLEYLKI